MPANSRWDLIQGLKGYFEYFLFRTWNWKIPTWYNVHNCLVRRKKILVDREMRYVQLKPMSVIPEVGQCGRNTLYVCLGHILFTFQDVVVRTHATQLLRVP